MSSQTDEETGLDPTTNSKFVLSAQQVVDIESRDVCATEVYIQSKESEEEAAESAGEIIDQANKAKNTLALDLFALTCLARVCENVKTDRLFINISPYSLCTEENLEQLREKLHPLADMDKQLVLEINNPPNELTSQEYIKMYSNCMKVARSGIKFATNPYYRSADVSTHLDAEHIPYLKIARPLLLKVRESEQARRALQRDIKIARIQRRIIIGEGVETEQELEDCLSLACDWVQGFYLGRPKPLFARGLSLDDDVI